MKRLARGEPGYEEARRAGIWQSYKPERYPALILRPESAADVQQAVREAIRLDLPIAVKGAGHNYTSTYLREGGMQLDLSGLADIAIEGETARVGPGVRSGELSAALGAVGRTFPTGHHSSVAMGGYLLGGGMGWNGENRGQFACFHVEALDVVMADGEAATISADCHPDLFWAARGAGPLFCAAVTRFHLRSLPLPSAVQGVRLAYPLEAAGLLSGWLEAKGRQGWPDVELILMYMTPLGAPAPCCVALLIYHGSDAEGGAAALGEILADAPAGGEGASVPFPLTYPALYAESLTGEARRTGADTIWTDQGAEASRILALAMSGAPSPGTVGIVNFRRPAALPADAACSMAGEAFLQWIGQWTDPAADAENFAWVAGVADLLEPVTKGCYVNETDIVRRPERLARCFSESAWRRLGEVRGKYDPEGRFPAPVPDGRP